MDFLVEKDLNCQIIPVIKKNLGKNDIQNFIKYIQETENNDYINDLIKIIEDSPEIGQIILDIHYIYKINGIIECLILKYIENDNNEGLIDFLIFLILFQNHFKLIKIYMILFINKLEDYLKNQ